MDCGDGVYCNGEEYCDDGQCYPAANFTCGGDTFLCLEDEESYLCIDLENCHSFDFDGFLQCSLLFVAAQNSIALINSNLTDIDTLIQELNASIVILIKNI